MTCLETFNHTIDHKGRRATFGIRRLNNAIYVFSYAITSEKDNFSRAKGRRIVQNRMDQYENPNNHFAHIFDVGLNSLHESITNLLNVLGINYSRKVVTNMLERDLRCNYTLEEINTMTNKSKVTEDIPF